MTKVSVIIPIFNGEKYIESCLSDLTKQTLKEFEVILINDGSTDKTAEICDRISMKNSNIKVIHQINQGVSKARNEGIKVATGEYLCFIDCDDYIDDKYLELLYNSCEINKVKISMCCIEVVDEFKKTINSKFINDGKYDSKYVLQELFRFKNINGGPCGKLFHKSLFKENLCFPPINTYEDLSFVYKAIYLSKSIYFVKNCKYYYVHRNGIGAMDKFIKNPTTDVIIVANEILEFIKINIPEIWDTSFYGLISQVLMYINDINKIDKSWTNKSSKVYIKATQKLLSKYRKEIIKNKSMFFKEKLSFILFSYSSNIHGNIIYFNKL